MYAKESHKYQETNAFWSIDKIRYSGYVIHIDVIEGLWIEILLHVYLWDFYAALSLISHTYWRVQNLLCILYIVISEDIDIMDVENSNPLDCLIRIHHTSNHQRVYETINLLDTLVCD